MGRPWTAIAKDNKTGTRAALIFEGSYDGAVAVVDFNSKFGNHSLEALIPGKHTEVYIEGGTTNINSGGMTVIKSLPSDKLFSGF